jgi:hypothetical protein
MGCVLIGPVDVRNPLGIPDNSRRSNQFNDGTPSEPGIPATSRPSNHMVTPIALVCWWVINSPRHWPFLND